MDNSPSFERPRDPEDRPRVPSASSISVSSRTARAFQAEPSDPPTTDSKAAREDALNPLAEWKAWLANRFENLEYSFENCNWRWVKAGIALLAAGSTTTSPGIAALGCGAAFFGLVPTIAATTLVVCSLAKLPFAAAESLLIAALNSRKQAP